MGYKMGIHGDLIQTDEGTKTCDLYLAAFFVSVDCQVLKTSREGKKVYFLFDKNEMIEKLKVSYFTRQAKVDALTYADNIKSLKSLCASIVHQDIPRA
jgi:hypothetical protein